jgi:hypothetical protein
MPSESVIPGMEELSALTNDETRGLINSMTAAGFGAQDILDEVKKQQAASKAARDQYVKDYADTAETNQ